MVVPKSLNCYFCCRCCCRCNSQLDADLICAQLCSRMISLCEWPPPMLLFAAQLGHHLCYLTCCRLTLNYGHAKARARESESGNPAAAAVAARRPAAEARLAAAHEAVPLLQPPHRHRRTQKDWTEKKRIEEVDITVHRRRGVRLLFASAYSLIS